MSSLYAEGKYRSGAPLAHFSFFFKHSCQLGAVLDFQFFINEGKCFFDGDFGYVHFTGDVFVFLSCHDEADDFHFSSGEVFDFGAEPGFLFQGLAGCFFFEVQNVFQQFRCCFGGFEAVPGVGKAAGCGEEGGDEVVRCRQFQGFLQAGGALAVFLLHVVGNGLVEEGVDFSENGFPLFGQSFVADGGGEEGEGAAGAHQAFVLQYVQVGAGREVVHGAVNLHGSLELFTGAWEDEVEAFQAHVGD